MGSGAVCVCVCEAGRSGSGCCKHFQAEFLTIILGLELHFEVSVVLWLLCSSPAWLPSAAGCSGSMPASGLLPMQSWGLGQQSCLSSGFCVCQ